MVTQAGQAHHQSLSRLFNVKHTVINRRRAPLFSNLLLDSMGVNFDGRSPLRRRTGCHDAGPLPAESDLPTMHSSLPTRSQGWSRPDTVRVGVGGPSRWARPPPTMMPDLTGNQPVPNHSNTTAWRGRADDMSPGLGHDSEVLNLNAAATFRRRVPAARQGPGPHRGRSSPSKPWRGALSATKAACRCI